MGTRKDLILSERELGVEQLVSRMGHILVNNS